MIRSMFDSLIVILAMLGAGVVASIIGLISLSMYVIALALFVTYLIVVIPLATLQWFLRRLLR